MEREKINMRPEILAPVGNREALEAAIAAGCDAVYFGLPVFGARAYAKNFSLEETEEIIKKMSPFKYKGVYYDEYSNL